MRNECCFHRFDTRAKLVFTLLMVVIVFVPSSPVWQTFLSILVLFLAVHETGVRKTMSFVRVILPVIVVMTLFLPLQSRDGEALLSFGETVIVTTDGLYVWQKMVNRFLSISVLCSLVAATTDESSIILALRFYRIPYGMALVTDMAIRFIPSLSSSLDEVRDALSLRVPSGVEANGVKERFSRLLNTLTSVLVSSLKGVVHTSQALEMRGYGRKEKRTSYRTLKNLSLVIPDFLVAVLVPLTLFIVMGIRR